MLRQVRMVFEHILKLFCLLLNLNSLLVKRQIDNPSPGAVTGKLVPSSHKRGELSCPRFLNIEV